MMLRRDRDWKIKNIFVMCSNTYILLNLNINVKNHGRSKNALIKVMGNSQTQCSMQSHMQFVLSRFIWYQTYETNEY